MKKLISTICLFLVALISVSNTSAHDPSKHKKMAAKPNCEAMASMNTSEMDANDSVMQAMMKKCESASDEHKMMSETKPAMAKCTTEHAEMGHCSMGHDKSAIPSGTKPEAKSVIATCTAEHAEMGHCTLSDEESAAQGENEDD